MSSNEGEVKKPRKEKKKKTTTTTQEQETKEEIITKGVENLKVEEKEPSYFEKLSEDIVNKEHQFWHNQPVLKICKKKKKKKNKN